MAVEIIMPKLGMSMEEGTVVEWLKKKGDPVKKGESIVVISSDKIEKDIEAPQDGVLLEIIVQQDETAEVGKVIGYIGQEGEVLKEADHESVAISMKEEIEAISETMLRVSPAARKLAHEAGIDLRRVSGSGPKGRITRADVEKAIQTRQASSQLESEEQRFTQINKEAINTSESINLKKKMSGQISEMAIEQKDVTVKPITGMRKVIATRMFASLHQTAQLTIHMKADITKLMEVNENIKNELRDESTIKFTITDFIARAVILSLRTHKQMNSLYQDGRIYTYDSVHLGIAVAVENGLVVPVIRYAEKLSLKEISQKIKELSTRAREGALSSEEMTGSTFTITSLGAYGVEFFTPVLNPPEVGILGVGTAEDVPVLVGDIVEKRKKLPLSLTFDHQVIDGAPASQFLGMVKHYLENPYQLFYS
ncbi:MULTISPECIES: dihydrolipoamide acetyltransferase family protein [Geobacillus]|uniref:Dihydrolipoamide acetyltransferase component of pyruvate dehydrogenase complex n=1 Tax=Geobacillus zalihae TaxID=213419 RepID=A0A7H1RWI2_9BACL|nr:MULTISPECIES: dihydrolipoamide acetyltransferase family protein [Geobacillus]MDF9298150.1 dihydrolipoamide acetyltransferase family protein [Geobacillus stearothermophilus]OQP17446.1 branched-chain alpha-keto acid dehydrogenase subunit E2 [Geobacillus zalihae]OQP24488.1 branched-chain alpha-keto acid dehydrogenase subunit E2 [Geobacillus zalihae]QNU18621.1 2-oxo acid dehydrogenase subunit E2 [Geobacillus zalihae]WJQ01538.1 dihydrolipoamide acetyltransferase family protein [Geobacillus stear